LSIFQFGGPLEGETETAPESDEGAFRFDDTLHPTAFPGPLRYQLL